MNYPTQQHLSDHNRYQLHYFESSEKERMIPRNTPYTRRQVDVLMRFGNIQPGQRVLEIGCGMGRYTLILAEHGVQIEGMDLSQVLLDKLRGYAGNRFNIPLYCFDIASIPPDLVEKFDAVIGFFALHHIHDLSLCFQSAARALKKGGKILFVEPNPLNLLYYFQILFTPKMKWRGERGMMRMRPDVIAAILEEAGFANAATTRFGFFPPFVTNTRPGMRLESIFEKFPLWRPFLPFQLFSGVKAG